MRCQSPSGHYFRSRMQSRVGSGSCIFTGECKVSIRVVPFEANTLVVGCVRSCAIHPQDLRIGPLYSSRVLASLLNTFSNPSGIA